MIDVFMKWSGEFVSATTLLVYLILVSAMMSIAFGLLGAVAKLSKNRWLAAAGGAYTGIFRGIPEYLLLLLIYFGSATTLTAVVRHFRPDTGFVDISPFWIGALAISLVVGAAAAETFRGAFLGVDRGQTEAAHALGLRGGQMFFLVQFPQMWRLALPGLGNQMANLVKDTSLISLIGLQELMYTADMVSTSTSRPLEVYLFVAAIYLGLTTFVSLVIASLERRANRHLVNRA